MLLRSRIVLIFTAATVLFTGLVAAPAYVLIRSGDERLSQTLLVDQSRLWNRSLRLIALPMVEKARKIADDPALMAGIAGQKTEDLSAWATSRQSDADFGQPIVRIDVVGAQGDLEATTAGRAAEEPMVDAVPVLRELSVQPDVLGVEFDERNKPVLVCSVPVAGGGFLSMAFGILPALKELAATVNADALIADETGRVLSATEGFSAFDLSSIVPSAHDITRLERDDGYYDLVPSHALGSGGGENGYVVTIRNVTYPMQQRQLLLLSTVGLATLVLGVVLAVLYGSIRSSLAPLDAITRAVLALARGDTMVAVDQPRRTDEVGRIAEALEVFRAHAIELDRVGFLERVERAQQQTLIHREMTNMAKVLEEKARAAVLSDLARIEEKVRDGAGAGGVLATAFRHMVGRVREQHRALSDLLAERTRDLAVVRQALAERTQLVRLREELEVARNLQLSSLPAHFPAYPDRVEFDIFALCRPAKEVGGDFYDHLLLDGRRLVLMVGDASGKGVSAAIFISMTRGLMRSQVTRGGTPAECLELTNNTQCAENPTMMFATAFMIVIDLATGDFVYANAGHNPPFLRHPDGTVEKLDRSRGTALGVIEDLPYHDVSGRLPPGATLLLYSDGATDAIDPASAIYGEDRVISSLSAPPGGTAESVVCQVLNGIDRFADTADQTDDITLLALTFRQPANPPAKDESAGGAV